jgi:REP element-mobilizing transposase RayT
LLGQLESRFGLEIHSYVLMDNHYHLLLRMAGATGLSVGMQWLGVSYSVWFNRRHRRSGHLFQGRFKAVVVDFLEWGASLSRYVHLNPVRTKRYGLDKAARAADRRGAGAVPDAEIVGGRIRALKDYGWSSYPAYCGWQTSPQWLRREEVLAAFGNGASGRKNYRRYVEEAIRGGMEETPWESLVGGLVLGGEELLEKVRGLSRGDPAEQPDLRAIRRKIELREIVDIVSSVKGEPCEAYRGRRGDWGQGMVLMAARRHAGIPNRCLAEWLGGKDDSAVTQAVKRLEERMKTSSELKKIYQAVELKLSTVKM